MRLQLCELSGFCLTSPSAPTGQRFRPPSPDNSDKQFVYIQLLITEALRVKTSLALPCKSGIKQLERKTKEQNNIFLFFHNRICTSITRTPHTDARVCYLRTASGHCALDTFPLPFLLFLALSLPFVSPRFVSSIPPSSPFPSPFVLSLRASPFSVGDTHQLLRNSRIIALSLSSQASLISSPPLPYFLSLF